MNMSMRIAMFSSGLALATATVLGCSDDTTPTPADTADAGSSGSSGSNGSSGTSGSSGTNEPETGPAALNGCRNYVDRTADDASRVVQWDVTMFQKEERCMKIKKGQKVTFSMTQSGGAPANFQEHPLAAQGGDTPNPVETALDQDTGEVTFAAAGQFGYICGIHPAMTGAVLVTE